jgi:hypothetical protein
MTKVQIEDNVTSSEECELALDLTIASIGANELRLIKKKYMDSPTIVEEERKEGFKH